jgi:hypothetical protein
MKRIFKIIGIIILSIIGIYTMFIIEESIRLSNDLEAKPVMVISKSDVYNDVIYYSLGFKLVNKYGNPQVDDEVESILVGQEFWLFDTFMLWGWIS